MGMLYVYKGMPPLTPEEKVELEALAQMSDDDIVYDEDCPRLTEEQLSKFIRVRDGKRVTMPPKDISPT